jgi:serine/threonine protein phosphatase PrpC
MRVIKGDKVLDMAEQIATSGGKAGGRRQSFTLSAETEKATKEFSEKKAVSEGLGAQDAKSRIAELGIGACCKKGLKPESPNQDSYTIIVAEDSFKLLGVYDGHGPNGHDVSNFAKDAVPKLFLENLKTMAPGDAFISAFQDTQKILEGKDSKIDSQASGSTCTFLYVPAGAGDMTVAHVGDSRAVIARKQGGKFVSEDLTEDHKPNLPKEKERIEKAGGRVVFDGYFNHRVFTRDGRGGLNMSRALGDCIAHKAGVSSTPEVKIVEIPKQPGEEVFVLLCSDGVWEFIESPEAIKMLEDKGFANRAKTQVGADYLAKEAYQKWLDDSEGEVADDITCVFAWLP